MNQAEKINYAKETLKKIKSYRKEGFGEKKIAELMGYSYVSDLRRLSNECHYILNNKTTCTLTGKTCMHASEQPDTGLFENCRLCDVYEEWLHKTNNEDGRYEPYV